MHEWMSRLRHYRFVVLLAALFLLLFAVPLIEHFSRQAPGVTYFTSGLLFVVIVASALFAVSRSRLTRVIVWTTIVTVVAVRVINWFGGIGVGTFVEDAALLLCLTYTVALVLYYLFSVERVTANTVAAALCVYLLLAVMWATAYAVVEAALPGSFSLPAGASRDLMTGYGDVNGRALYYSLVTMTTLGYGDITPVTLTAQMLSALQAVVGQIYLAVLVARLVSLMTSERQMEE